MPCLNEAETLATCIARRSVPGAGPASLARSWSPTTAAPTARRDRGAGGARVVPMPAQGLRRSADGGIAAARGRFVIMGDADDSYDFAALDAVRRALREGADLVMGNRFRGGIAAGAMPALHRYLGNPVLSFLGRLFFRGPMPRLPLRPARLRRGCDPGLGLQTPGMEFASEMVVGRAGRPAHRRRCRRRCQARRPQPPAASEDLARRLAASRFLLMYNPRWLFFIPGLSLCALGALLSGLLFFGPLEVAAICRSTSTASSLPASWSWSASSWSPSACCRALCGYHRGPARQCAFRLAGQAYQHRPARPQCRDLPVGWPRIFGYAVLSWAQLNFGPLSNPEIPRVVILRADAHRDCAAGVLLGIPARRAANPGHAPADRPSMKAMLQAALRLRAVRFLTVGVGSALLFFVLTYALTSLGMPPSAGARPRLRGGIRHRLFGAAQLDLWRRPCPWPRPAALLHPASGMRVGLGRARSHRNGKTADVAAGHVRADHRGSLRGELFPVVSLGVCRSFGAQLATALRFVEAHRLASGGSSGSRPWP